MILSLNSTACRQLLAELRYRYYRCPCLYQLLAVHFGGNGDNVNCRKRLGIGNSFLELSISAVQWKLGSVVKNSNFHRPVVSLQFV